MEQVPVTFLNVRFTMKGKPVPWKRAKLVVLFAKLLRVPLDIEEDPAERPPRGE